MPNKKIVAILGLPGSGKSEVINYLIGKYKWPRVYFGGVTFDEMKKQKLEINEKNERMIREGLRKKYGNLYYADQVIKKIGDIDSDTILVESLYSWEEYLTFKKKYGNDFIDIAVYASPKIRYERLGKRKTRPLTPEDAQSRDYAQIENLRQAGPIVMANHTIINNGTLEKLYKQVDGVVE